MSQNRKRRAEPDEIKSDSSPKAVCLNDSPIESQLLKEIMGELKEIREEIKKNQEKNEMKFEMLKIEMEREKLKQKEDALNSKSTELNNCETLREIRRELKENQEKSEKIIGEMKVENRQKMDELKDEIGAKLSELETKILEKITTNQQLENEKMNKISKELASIREDVPRNIRREILGEWKMIEHENFDGYMKIYPKSNLEQFSQNVKYSMENGLLKQTGGSYKDMKEGENEPDHLRIFVEDNHLKTDCKINTIDRFIQNGKLHVVHHQKEETWIRVYEKI